MRVLHVITDLDTGGAEIMLLKLLSAGRGLWESEVVSLKDQGTVGPRITNLGIPVSSLGMGGAPFDPIHALAVRSIVKRLHPSLVVGWMYHGNIVASLATVWASQPPPVIWNIRQSFYDIMHERRRTAAIIRLGALISRRPSNIVYNSQVSARQHQAFGYCAANQIVIPNGFDLKIFHPDSDGRKKIRAELRVPQDALLVGLIARYHPMKDHTNFLKAAGSVAKRHANVYFVLAGKGVTQEQPVLARLISEQQLQQRVFLLGERNDPPSLNAAFDIACSASAWGEGFCNAIGEAMACGVPCVVTDIGDSGFIISDTGLLVPPGNSRALAEAMMSLIAAGPGDRQQLGGKARQRVKKEFSLESVVRRYDALYREVLAGKPSNIQ